MQNIVFQFLAFLHFSLPLFPTFLSVCFPIKPILSVQLGLSPNLFDSIGQFLFAQFAFPHNHDFPSLCFKKRVVTQVSFPIGLDLLDPELAVALGLNISVAAFVAMPETSVHKDTSAVFCKNNVRTSRKALDVDSVSIPSVE